MAYFHCLIGGGSSGGGYELTVTCDSAFASSTITCTDGVTTLTQTCPSSSPYEVVFEIPNGGDWTISGTTGGHTVSTGVSIPTSAELIAIIQQTVTIYSAKEDTISYVDIDGATQTITFASGATSKQVTIEIEASGSSITFTSGVAKDPSNLSNYYSKTVTITSNTTEVYLMPDNALYWWGYESSELEDMSTANGWSTDISPFTFGTPTRNTNYIDFNSSTGNTVIGVGAKNKHSGNFVAIIEGITLSNNAYGGFQCADTKSWFNLSSQEIITNNAITKYELSNQINKYMNATSNYSGGVRRSYLYAMWYE